MTKRTNYVKRRLYERSARGFITWSSRRSPLAWIVDLDEPVSLLDCYLAESFGYQDGGSITGVIQGVPTRASGRL